MIGSLTITETCLQPTQPVPGCEIVWSTGIEKARTDEANTFVSLVDYKYVIFFVFRDSTASKVAQARVKIAWHSFDGEKKLS